MPFRAISFSAIGIAFLMCGPLPAAAQTAPAVVVGLFGLSGGNLNPSGVETVLQTFPASYIDGSVTSATFGWSNSPCPAAVKIKFFRPFSRGTPTLGFTFLTERGPFDVTEPLAGDTFNGAPRATQTVALDPPVPLQAGDIIAVANLTDCGGPTLYAEIPLPVPLPPLPPYALSYAGDVSTTVLQSAGRVEKNVSVIAIGPASSIVLLNRFQITLLATDPRNGRRTAGAPVGLSGTYLTNTASGYFSLPDFTGDPTFPEVIVKMVDATGAPGLGGDFWFFHAPLTDVQYTITVTDLTTRAVRTYTNASASPGQLCGGVDTSAFPGP